MGIGGSSRIYWVSQFPGKLPYDDEIATSWLSCELGPVRHKGTVGPWLLSGLQGQTHAKELGSAR